MLSGEFVPQFRWSRLHFVVALFVLLLAIPIPASAQTTPNATKPGQEFCLTRDPAKVGKMSGKVTSAATDEPLFNVRVEVEDIYGRLTHWAYTRDDGTWDVDSLAPLEYFVTFTAPYSETPEPYITEVYSGLSGAANATIVKVGTAQSVTGIDAALKLGAIIEGKVTSSVDGSPIEDVQASVIDTSTEEWIAFAFTESDGTYRFDQGFAPGDYLMWFYEDGYKSVYFDNVELREDATPVTIVGTQTKVVNAVLDPEEVVEVGEGTIKGRITLADTGEPAVGAYVQPLAVGETNGWVSWALADSQGYYTATVPAGTWIIQVDPSWQHSEYAERNLGGDGSTPNAEVITVAAGATVANKNVALSKGWYIEGVIKGPGSSIIKDILPSAVEGDGSVSNRLSQGSSRASSEDTFKIGPLTNTSFTVSVTTRRSESCTLIDKSVLVNPPASPGGTVTLTIDLEQGGLIAGRVTTGTPAKGNGDGYVEVFRGEERVESLYASDTGHYLTNALSAGAYKARISAWGYKPQFFDNKPDLASATVLQVAAGQTVIDVNALLVARDPDDDDDDDDDDDGGGATDKIFVPIIMK